MEEVQVIQDSKSIAAETNIIIDDGLSYLDHAIEENEAENPDLQALKTVANGSDDEGDEDFARDNIRKEEDQRTQWQRPFPWD